MTIEIDAKQFMATLANKAKKLSNATAPLKEIGLRMGDWTIQTFKNEGARAGHAKWQKLEESTINAPFRIATSKKEQALQKSKGLKVTQSKIRKPYAVYKRDDTGKLQKKIISNRRGPLNILHPRGTLMQSFKVLKLTANELNYGSQLKVNGQNLGSIHQFGLGNNPVREIIFFRPSDMKTINEVFARWMAA